MQSLYCDGGVVLSNPSLIGGTWAWCLVEDNKIIKKDSGFIPYRGQFPITSNQAEVRAMLETVKQIPLDWVGTLYSDSQVSLGRIFKNWRWNNVPETWYREYQDWRKTFKNIKNITPVFIGGHPTKEELRVGKNHRGFIVSEWNVWCHEECKRIARQHE